MESWTKSTDRRSKYRFDMQRELRYKVTGDGVQPVSGTGTTVNLSSAGVAFAGQHRLKLGAFVELSISWPVQLEDGCAMRLIAFGRVVRVQENTAACSIDKYEFRTAPRAFKTMAVGRSDDMLQRWADGMRKESMKESLARA